MTRFFGPWAHWHRGTPAAGLVMALAIVITGCGSSASSGSSPTATPRPAMSTATAMVVTATPAPQKVATVKVVQVVVTATPRIPKGARYTPQPSHGVVTPLPHATPVSAASGLRLGMITRPVSKVTAVQAGINANNKAFLFYTHPTQVVRKTLPQYGFRPPIKVVSPAKPVNETANRPLQKAVVKYGGTLYKVYVAQPGTHGARGAWFIVTILRQQLRTGMITRSLATVKRLQQRADSGNKNYAFYLNPTQVIKKGLPQYGFEPPFTILRAPHPVPSASGRPLQRATIKYDGDLYTVDVAQPVTRGPRGVWVIVTIARA